MYNLYTDKPETFKCKIKLEGASLNKSVARVILESQNINLLFKGTINSEGLCEVSINKLKDLLPEDATGKIKLEIIAEDDVYFCPWSSDFTVQASKKLTLEVLDNSTKSTDKKPRIQISGIKEDPCSGLVKLLKEYKVNKEDIHLKNRKILPIIFRFKKEIGDLSPVNRFLGNIRDLY